MTEAHLTDYQIGVDLDHMVYLENLVDDMDAMGIDWRFEPHSVLQDTAAGTVRGLGWPTAQWILGLVSRAFRDELREFCPGPSAEVYITTRTSENSDEYATFLCEMVWPNPKDEGHSADQRLDLVINFRKLVLQEP